VTGAPDGAARAQALVRASEPPLAIAECAADVAEAAAQIARAGAWGFTADAVVAGELAVAAARSGAELVAANLAGAADDPRTDRARAAADRAERASRSARNGSGG
jgi:formiminotetrahydrofolate cyclodeaminase